MITPPRIVYSSNGTIPAGVSSGGGDASLYEFVRLLETVQERVLVIDVAELLCGPAGNRSGWHRVGDLWLAGCLLPEHECPWSFSFAVSKDENRWYCCECRVVRDVLDLYAFAGRYTDKGNVLTDLARERGVRP